MNSSNPWHVLDEKRHELGEGARHLDGHFHYVNLLRGELYRWNGVSGQPSERAASLGVPLGAVAKDPLNRGLLAAAGTGVGVLYKNGSLDMLADFGVDGEKVRVNDAVLDSYGLFWVGTMAYEATPGHGALHVYDPRGGFLKTVLEDITIPNGPALWPDGGTMYLADSDQGVIFSFTVDRCAGALVDGAVFAIVRVGSPDGMTVDDEGNLWCAIWGGARIDQFDRAGRLKKSCSLPVQQPTSVIKAGPEPHVLITSATLGLDDLAKDLDGATLAAPWPLQEMHFA